MKKVYDFSKGRRRAVIPTTGKTRIMLYLDDAVLKRVKVQSGKTGKGYQTLINDALKSCFRLESDFAAPAVDPEAYAKELKNFAGRLPRVQHARVDRYKRQGRA